jgi:hypothetical protein
MWWRIALTESENLPRYEIGDWTPEKSVAYFAAEYGRDFGSDYTDIGYVPTSAVRPSESVDHARVAQIKAAILAGKPLPPLILDDSFGIRDGHHRHAAAEALGLEVPVLLYGDPEHLKDPSAHTPEELASWAQYRYEREAEAKPVDFSR